jgi:hypothetical protein
MSILTSERFGHGARNPLDAERARGHRIVGPCEQGRPRERHWVAALISAIAAVVAAGVTTAAAVSAADQQAAAAKQQAKFNKRAAENAALAARQKAAIDAQEQRELDLRRAAVARAAVGASGVMGDTGTPLLIELENAERTKLNEARVLYSGEQGAQAFESEIPLIQFRARQAQSAAGYSRGASLLSGVASATSAGVKGYQSYSMGRVS